MSGPVDVLAVMECAELCITAHRHAPVVRSLAEARAAVAELIAADKEFDASYAEFPAVGAEKAAIERGAARINAARYRRAAALANVGGAA